MKVLASAAPDVLSSKHEYHDDCLALINFCRRRGKYWLLRRKELPFFGLTHSRILQLLPQKAFECGVEYFRQVAEDAKLEPQDALIIYSYEGQNVRHTILIRQLLIVESPKAFSRMDLEVRASEYHRTQAVTGCQEP